MTLTKRLILVSAIVALLSLGMTGCYTQLSPPADRPVYNEDDYYSDYEYEREDRYTERDNGVGYRYEDEQDQQYYDSRDDNYVYEDYYYDDYDRHRDINIHYHYNSRYIDPWYQSPHWDPFWHTSTIYWRFGYSWDPFWGWEPGWAHHPWRYPGPYYTSGWHVHFGSWHSGWGFGYRPWHYRSYYSDYYWDPIYYGTGVSYVEHKRRSFTRRSVASNAPSRSRTGIIKDVKTDQESAYGRRTATSTGRVETLGRTGSYDRSRTSVGTRRVTRDGNVRTVPRQTRDVRTSPPRSSSRSDSRMRNSSRDDDRKYIRTSPRDSRSSDRRSSDYRSSRRSSRSSQSSSSSSDYNSRSRNSSSSSSSSGSSYSRPSRSRSSSSSSSSGSGYSRSRSSGSSSSSSSGSSRSSSSSSSSSRRSSGRR